MGSLFGKWECQKRGHPLRGWDKAQISAPGNSMDVEGLQEKVIEFRDARDWAEYHNPKDLAISSSLEAAELVEIFQCKDQK